MVLGVGNSISNSIHTYYKDETRTNTLVSCEKIPIGEGDMAKVYVVRDNKTMVVKKSYSDLTAEFKLGWTLEHSCYHSSKD